VSASKPKIVAFHTSPAKRIAEDKAEPYGRELLRIERERGGLDNATIVEEASRKSSPIHDAFTWDDSEAARQFRLVEAHQLKTSIEVDVRFPDGSVSEGLPLTHVITVRYTSGPRKGETERRVESVIPVLSDRTKAAAAVAECKAQFIAMSHRWEQMRSASDKALVRVLDAVADMERGMATGAGASP
jgi:hypothetical protein